LDLLQRLSGATLEEIMNATGWQPHSVRGFISGTLGKKMGLTITSSKRDDGQRIYSVKSYSPRINLTRAALVSPHRLFLSLRLMPHASSP